MSPVQLGIIGLGAMGAEMLDVATHHPDFTVRRASDVNQAALDRLTPAHPTVEFSTNAAAVVDATDLDAVYIATPPAFHAPLAIAAMRSGKAVFCEKPLAISLTDGQRMRDAAAECGLATAVNFALSDRQAVLEIERRLRAGEAGTVLGVDIRLQFPHWPRDFQADAAWLATPKQGGFLREVFSHFAYLTDRLLGPLRLEDVNVDRPAGATEVAARVMLRAGDVPVHLSAVSGVAGPEIYEWVLSGYQQSYTLRDWDELLVSEGDGWTTVDLAGDRGSEATRLSLFAEAINGRPQADLADFDTALRVQQVVEALCA